MQDGANRCGASDVAWRRIIAHADMDAFYAAVEQLDDPALRGRPILVGSNSHRGVVLTASYEARPFGVGSAMPMAEARRRCPQALVVPPRFERYRQLSSQIMQVFADFSPRVEALSLDEAFLDMSGSEAIFGPPVAIGKRLKHAIFDATGGLTASVGLSATKYVAKVASARGKPDGLVVVPAAEAAAWLAPLPVSCLWGAGPKTQLRLRALGYERIGQLARADVGALMRAFGRTAERFITLSRAEDPRPVRAERAAKSIGFERTLPVDIAGSADIAQELRRAADAVARRLRGRAECARGVRVKLKTADFRILTRQRQVPEPTDLADLLFAEARRLLAEFDDPGPVRLVGVTAYALQAVVRDASQLPLALTSDSSRTRRLETVLDRVAERFGPDAMRRAADLSRAGDIGASSDLDFLTAPGEDETARR